MKSRRIEEMETYILEKHQVKIEELVAYFDVSLNTVRRDINELVKRGTITKVYGGVQATEIRNLIPFENRHIAEAEEKKALSKIAAGFIEANDMVFIDSGTTTQYILDYLDSELPFTLLTNNFDIIQPATSRPNITLIVIGSTYNHKTRSFVTVQHDVLEAYNINKAFMATSGLTLTSGLTNSEHAEYLIKEHIVKKANHTYLLADHTKFGKAALLTYASLSDIDTIISSSAMPESYKALIAEHGCQLIADDGLDSP